MAVFRGSCTVAVASPVAERGIVEGQVPLLQKPFTPGSACPEDQGVEVLPLE